MIYQQQTVSQDVDVEEICVEITTAYSLSLFYYSVAEMAVAAHLAETTAVFGLSSYFSSAITAATATTTLT